MSGERRYLVWSNEHGGWWGADARGYADKIERAGLYTEAEADAICQKANQYLPKGKFNEVKVLSPQAPKKTTINPVNYDFKGSTVEALLKRAGGVIECGFHVFTVHRKSEDRWKNIVIFEDMEKQTFCYAFELGGDGSVVMADLLIRGVRIIDMKEPGGERLT